MQPEDSNQISTMISESFDEAVRMDAEMFPEGHESGIEDFFILFEGIASIAGINEIWIRTD